MNTNLLPGYPVGSDHSEPVKEHVALEAAAASVDTDPGGDAGIIVKDSAMDEPEWYPPPDTPCM